MNRDDHVLKGIVELIPDILFPKGEYNLSELKLEEDLSIFGDDAVEFIDEFSKKFNVNISNLDFSKYFTKETSFYFIYKLFPFLANKNKQVLTLGDLVLAVKNGVLE